MWHSDVHLSVCLSHSRTLSTRFWHLLRWRALSESKILLALLCCMRGVTLQSSATDCTRSLAAERHAGSTDGHLRPVCHVISQQHSTDHFFHVETRDSDTDFSRRLSSYAGIVMWTMCLLLSLNKQWYWADVDVVYWRAFTYWQCFFFFLLSYCNSYVSTMQQECLKSLSFFIDWMQQCVNYQRSWSEVVIRCTCERSNRNCCRPTAPITVVSRTKTHCCRPTGSFQISSTTPKFHFNDTHASFSSQPSIYATIYAFV